MSQENRVLFKYFSGNLIQLLQVVGLVFILMSAMDFANKALTLVFWIYLVPPLFVRVLYFIFGRPEGRLTEVQQAYWVWYFGMQAQAIFLRFRFLEEILRTVPLVYSNWLRLWGAKIGKAVYWSPQVTVVDRTHLEVGDYVIVGYGAGMTAHHLNRDGVQEELILSAPRVEDHVVLGGLSGLTPGSVVCEGETLPSTMGLAPFYVWRNGRRYAPSSQKGA